MNRNLRYFRKRIMLVLVMFGFVMLGIGGILFRTMNNLVKTYAEEKLASEAKAAADYYYDELYIEMEKLIKIAEILENDDVDSQEENVRKAIEYIKYVYTTEPRIVVGIMSADCEQIYGEELPIKEYRGILESLQGKVWMSYTDTGSLLYTYPIIHKDNVHYVLYGLFSKNFIREFHGTDAITNLGDVMIMTNDGYIVCPYSSNNPEKEKFFNTQSVMDEFESLVQRHNLEIVPIDLKNTTLGRKLFFSAEIKNTSFVIAGMKDYDEALGSMSGLPAIIVSIYLVFVIIVMILAIYLIFASVKIRESIELKAAKEEAEQASNAKSIFLANMSHEIRTPINAILGFDEIILREYNDPTLRQYATSIKSSTTTLLNLVNGILDYSRMEAGKITLAEDPYDVKNMIGELITMIKPRVDSKKLELLYQINPDLPAILIGDVVRMKQLIINILSNAVKYTKEGHVELRIDYDVIDKESISLKVYVEDTGIGMTEESLKKLFNAFERFDEDKNKTIEGTGLGMSIAKQILDKMNSEMVVKSVYGKGSEFSFAAVQKVYDWSSIGEYTYFDAEKNENEVLYQPEFVAPGKSILIVDDTEMNLVVVTGLLKSTKLNIYTATSGKQALDMINDKVYDAMLIDQRMPEMDGMELIKHIRENTSNGNHDKPCIVLTANTVRGARESCLEAGFDDYLEKPVDGKTLEKMLQKYLGVESPAASGVTEENTSSDQVEAEASEFEDSFAYDDPIIENDPQDEVNKKLQELEEKGLINIRDGEMYAGSIEMFVTTLTFFRDNIEAKADEIEELYFKEDIENYTTKVHALKSSARIIGAAELSEHARQLEMAGNENNMDYIRDNNSMLLKEYREYIDYLKDI